MKPEYERIKTLGKGSFGEAALVRHKASAKLYVAKRISVAPSELGAAKREASVLHALSRPRPHSNIVSYVDSWSEPGPPSTLVILMEYANGGDLAALIARRRARRGLGENARGGEFAEEKVMRLFVQLACALAHVHGRKVLHRDLKPGNVFLTTKGVVKLGDFGVAKQLESTLALARTQTGTPFYLSPEIFLDQPYDDKSDLWSLGVVLFETAALELPFPASSIGALARQVTNDDAAPRVRQCLGVFSAELRAIAVALLRLSLIHI